MLRALAETEEGQPLWAAAHNQGRSVCVGAVDSWQRGRDATSFYNWPLLRGCEAHPHHTSS